MPERWHIECHYSDCDICGSGQDAIFVTFPGRNETAFTLRRESKCHGDVDHIAHSVGEVREWLEKQEFLLATRRSIRQYEELVASLKRYEERGARQGERPAAERVMMFVPEASLPNVNEITVSNVQAWAELNRVVSPSTDQMRTLSFNFNQAITDGAVIR